MAGEVDHGMPRAAVVAMARDGSVAMLFGLSNVVF